MAYGAGGSAAAVAAARAAAIANAIKASGAIVQVEPDDFILLLSKVDRPLVVMATGGFMKKNYQYLTGYKGLIFFTKSPTPLMLPGGAELIASKKIWIPN
ncbi:MAG: hypothetical protein V1932_06785 [Chloroflexota bacterium]